LPNPPNSSGRALNFYNLGSTGSLIRASTANTHSCTRRSGSRANEAVEGFEAEGVLAQS